MDWSNWFEEMSVTYQRRAYELAWRLCPSEETAVKIVATAVELAYKDLRRQIRRDRDSPGGYRIWLSDPQLVQLGILEAAEKPDMPPCPDPWLAYVAHLTRCTLPMNSFHVAVGFGRFLTNGSNEDVLNLYYFLDPRDFQDPRNRMSQESTNVSKIYKCIVKKMAKRFPMLALSNQETYQQIPKQDNDLRYHALTAMVPWGSDHLPATYQAFDTRQAARRGGLNRLLDRLESRLRGVRTSQIRRDVEVERIHVFIDQHHCLERVKQWPDVALPHAFTEWRVPNNMHQPPVVDPWQPPGNADWERIIGEIMDTIDWRQLRERRRRRTTHATFEVRVDGQLRAVITPDRHDAVEIPLPASARYVEIQDPESQVLVATCHLMDPHDLPRRGWRRAVSLPDGGRLRFTFSADPDAETGETGLRMTIRRSVPILSSVQAWRERVLTWWNSWVRGAAMGVLLVIGIVLGAWLFRPQVPPQQMTPHAGPRVTWALGVSQEEWHGLKNVKDDVLEPKLGARIDLQPINRDGVISDIDYMAATDTMPDLIEVDNDTLGILAQRGMVQDLTPYLLVAALPQDSLFQEQQEKHRINGRYYSVAFHPNVKLMYYNQDMLDIAKKQPPSTWEELYQLARDLDNRASQDPDSWGRIAIQAHDGKAAAVTAFEWIKSMGGDPLNLRGPEAQEAFREAFKRLWKLAPYLEPESKNIQFDTANNFLIANKVSMIDNWTYGIKVVMGVHQKQNIKVTRGLPGSFHVLGGDVLAIPTGISKERVERAIKLIEQLVAKETQRALAEKLFWAPVREDVYAELYAQKGMTEEYFRVIREVLRDAAIRPITPYWDIVQEVLSEALREVLKQAPARKDLETDAQIDAHIDSLLKPYIKKLQDIPLEIESCVVVERATTIGDECQVEVKTDISYRDLASKLNKDAATLAIVNGRGELDIVSPKKTQIILVPNKKG